VRLANETVVGILTGIHRAHAVELAHQDRGQQVIGGGGIVGVTIRDLLELLDGAVKIHAVEVIEGGIDQRIPGGRTGHIRRAAMPADGRTWAPACREGTQRLAMNSRNPHNRMSLANGLLVNV